MSSSIFLIFSLLFYAKIVFSPYFSNFSPYFLLGARPRSRRAAKRNEREPSPLAPCTQSYTYSRTALYQELDELCRLVDKYKHLGMA
jgi:hypothetical protein